MRFKALQKLSNCRRGTRNATRMYEKNMDFMTVLCKFTWLPTRGTYTELHFPSSRDPRLTSSDRFDVLAFLK